MTDLSILSKTGEFSTVPHAKGRIFESNSFEDETAYKFAMIYKSIQVGMTRGQIKYHKKHHKIIK